MIMARLYPLALLALLAAWSLTLPGALRRLRERLERAKPGTAYLLFALLVAAFALRAAQPGRFRVFDDEFEHLDAARHVAARGLYAVTVAGGAPQLQVDAAPTWPAGHHAALAAWMIAAGDSTRAARAWSVLLGVLTVLLVFWAALEWWDDDRSALAAALAWAVLPLAVRYCAAVDLTASSLFWSACVLAGVAARQEAFLALSLAYAVNVRPENALLIPFAAVCARPRLVVPALAAAAFPAAIAWANRAGGVAGYAASDFAPLSNLARQAGPNAAFLFLPVLLGAFRRPLRAAPLLGLALALFCVYGAFYRGLFGVGAEDRYALFVLLPLTVAAAPALRDLAPLLLGLSLLSTPREPVEHERARRLLTTPLPSSTLVLGFNASKLRETTRLPSANVYFALEDLDGLLKLADAKQVAVWKDWGWRTRPEVGAKLEAELSARYPRKDVVAQDGDDALELFSPALPAPR